MLHSGTLSIKEASEFARIGEKTIRSAVKSGKLPAIKLGVRRIRLREEAILAWLKALEQPQKGRK